MSIIAAIALWSAMPIVQDEDSRRNLTRCGNHVKELLKHMYNDSIRTGGAFPTEKGPAFWAVLLKNGGIKNESALRCPVNGRLYTGPRSDSNAYGNGEPMSLCVHKDRVVIIMKAGDVHYYDRDGEEHKHALEMTFGFFGWAAVGTTWTYRPIHKNGQPLRIETKKVLTLGKARGAVMVTTGGDLKAPVREELYRIESGVHVFSRSIGEKQISIKLSEGDLKKISSWAQEIGSEDFTTRENATAELAKQYPFAREEIEKALANANLEIRSRLAVIRKRSIPNAPAKVLTPLEKGATWENPFGERYRVIDTEEVETPFGTLDGWMIRMQSSSGESEIVWSDQMGVLIAVHRIKDGKRASGWVLDAYVTGK